jgi:putative flippase GtrA
MTTQWQLVAFLFVGGLNTLFGYATYALFIYLGCEYPIAVLLSAFFGLLFNFNTIGKMVFKSFTYKVFYKFVALYVFLYFFNVIFIKYMHTLSGNFYVDGLVGVIPSAIISFILNKYIVFRNVCEAN